MAATHLPDGGQVTKIRTTYQVTGYKVFFAQVCASFAPGYTTPHSPTKNDTKTYEYS